MYNHAKKIIVTCIRTPLAIFKHVLNSCMHHGHIYAPVLISVND